MDPRYTIVDENDNPILALDQIEDCKRWIAEEFKISYVELDGHLGGRMSDRRRFGSFVADDGRRRTIVDSREVEAWVS